MNNQHVIRALAIAALVIAGAAAIGVGAYNAGVAHGMAESGTAMTAAPPAGAYVYAWPRPWGFGFGFFPIFFFVFLFFALRGLLWRGAWRGPRASWYDGVPPAFEEWHRRAHAQQGPPQPTSGPTT